MCGQSVFGRYTDNPVLAWTSCEVSRVLVIATLSQALDLTEGEAPGHALRTAWISDQLAKAVGVPDEVRSDVLWAALLKDAGCSANAHPVAAWFGTDDRRAKRDLKRVDWSRPVTAAHYAISHARPGDPWSRRVAQLVQLARRGRSAATQLVEMRCTRGADIVRELGWVKEIPMAVIALDEHWDGSGEPYHLQGEAIPWLARVLNLAQTVEISWRDGGPSLAMKVVSARRGRWFAPDLVDDFLRLATDEFWARLNAVRSPEDALVFAPDDVVQQVLQPTDLVHVARVFGGIVDAKSPWTQRHSERTAQIANAIARNLGWSSDDVEAVRLAALWHDLGKLGVSNRILDKSGPLTAQERAEMNRHPEWTARILQPLKPLSLITEAAAAHHERLDGSGYHRQLKADQIPPIARIVAVADIFEALTSARPYKPAYDADHALGLLKQAAGTHLDPVAVLALSEMVGRETF
jgi:putative nucleotidyltransferase with HDIG domain